MVVHGSLRFKSASRINCIGAKAVFFTVPIIFANQDKAQSSKRTVGREVTTAAGRTVLAVQSPACSRQTWRGVKFPSAAESEKARGKGASLSQPLRDFGNEAIPSKNGLAMPKYVCARPRVISGDAIFRPVVGLKESPRGSLPRGWPNNAPGVSGLPQPVRASHTRIGCSLSCA